jgi:hypothetical protein
VSDNASNRELRAGRALILVSKLLATCLFIGGAAIGVGMIRDHPLKAEWSWIALLVPTAGVLGMVVGRRLPKSTLHRSPNWARAVVLAAVILLIQWPTAHGILMVVAATFSLGLLWALPVGYLNTRMDRCPRQDELP